MTQEHSETHTGASHYNRFLVMTAMHFVAMYFLMYSMVNITDNVHHNLNQVYMAGVMTASMVLIELLLMGSMYERKRLNALILGVGLVALIGFFAMIREQVAISDRQFLKSMIPHHAGAILMCEQAPIRAAAIRQLCGEIVASQQSEIEQMRAMLRQSSR